MYPHNKLYRFKSVANYISAVPRRESDTLRADIEEIDASNTRRNPFSKEMRAAAVEELRRRGEPISFDSQFGVGA